MESWRSRTELLVLQRERSTLPGKLEMLVWMLLASCREAEGAHSLPTRAQAVPNPALLTEDIRPLQTELEARFRRILIHMKGRQRALQRCV